MINKMYFYVTLSLCELIEEYSSSLLVRYMVSLVLERNINKFNFFISGGRQSLPISSIVLHPDCYLCNLAVCSSVGRDSHTPCIFAEIPLHQTEYFLTSHISSNKSLKFGFATQPTFIFIILEYFWNLQLNRGMHPSPRY